ncbi:MAG TPA: DUF11 domain-containing protein, partial [Blastocatellia bacterium]|nr:DUF11 domain-containing protein [Blastocatellia bacterium]
TGADLSITISDTPDPVPTGKRLTYRITVTNNGTVTANNVLVTTATPNETTFASASHPQASTPQVGGTGPIGVGLGVIAPGGIRSFDLVFNVLAVSGSTISGQALVISDTADVNQANNQTTAATKVEGGGLVELRWRRPDPTPENPTPQPTDLEVVPATGFVTGETATPSAIAPQEEGMCRLVQANIYKSETSPAAAIPENLWRVVPPQALKAIMAAAPEGSFYTVTYVYDCNGTTIESLPSNEGSAPRGATVLGAALTPNGNKLKATGVGFSPQVDVMIDGVGFSSKGKGKGGGTKLVQKGRLTDGRTMLEAIPPGRKVLLTFVNANGGIASYSFMR